MATGARQRKKIKRRQVESKGDGCGAETKKQQQTISDRRKRTSYNLLVAKHWRKPFCFFLLATLRPLRFRSVHIRTKIIYCNTFAKMLGCEARDREKIWRERNRERIWGKRNREGLLGERERIWGKRTNKYTKQKHPEEVLTIKLFWDFPKFQVSITLLFTKFLWNILRSKRGWRNARNKCSMLKQKRMIIIIRNWLCRKWMGIMCGKFICFALCFFR